MAIIEKLYTYEKGEENLYNIDTYNTDSTKKSLEISNSNNIKFKNLSDNRNTDNFYGDGRHGVYQKRDSTPIRPKCIYFWEIQNHPIYGWCMWKQWYAALGNFVVGDEIILYKKHIEKDDYLDQLGDWEVVTVTEIINDSDGVHYVLDRAPTYEWTNKTCNSATIIYQYESLEIFDNCAFTQDVPANTYISTPTGMWEAGRVRVSSPDGIVYLKSQNQIKIGRNSNISCRYGYNGAHAYTDYYTLHSYATASGPRGAGALEAGTALTTSLIDPRSPGCIRYSYSIYTSAYGTMAAQFNSHVDRAYTGGFVDGRYGINHTANTAMSREYGISSDDLNRKLYCGIGSATQSIKNEYTGEGSYHSLHSYGRSGGGILIIQTPKMIFEDKSSHVAAYETGTGSNQYLGYGGGGSLLVKVEELVFKENPAQWATYNGKLSSATVDYRADSSFRTGHIHDTYTLLISNPGLIQIEFDRWNNQYENITYTIDTIDETVKRNHVFDYKIEAVKSLRGLLGTLTPWNVSDSLKYFDHGHGAPVYESGSWFKLFTKGYNNINITEWEDIVKLFSSAVLPTGTSIKVAFSTTGGDSWFYIKDIKTAPVMAPMALTQTDFNTKGNDVLDLDDFTSSFFLTNSFIFSQADKDSKTIDICIAMKTTKSHITPLMNYIWFDYNKINSISSPIPIRPFNGEEFENEYVNFIWLQPESRRGSVQNRIEISDVPSFNQLYKNITAVPTDTSSTAGKIHIPFSGTEYNDYANHTKNFKLPYLKKRALPVTVSGEERLPSIKWENSKVKYSGGDIYFRKGTTVPLLSQVDLAAPTTKYSLENITIPRESNLISHYKFYGLSNFSKSSIIKDNKLNNIFDFNTSVLNDGLVRNENNVLYGETPAFNGKPNSNIILQAPTGGILSTMFGNTNSNFTIMYRFIASDLILNQWNGVASITSNASRHMHIMEIYPYMDNGNKYYRTRNYTHSYEQYTELPGFEEGAESVVVLVFNNTSVDMYINGTLVSTNTTRHIFTGGISVELGNRSTMSLNACGLNGHFLEFGIWDIPLTASEIKEISKISYWHLRYDFVDNKLKWHQVPYTEHLEHYQFVADKQSVINQRVNTYLKGTVQHFALGANEIYYNYHDTLLMGKYKPFRNIINAFSIEEGIHRPIQIIPHVVKRTVTPVNNYRDANYYDNNSFNYKYATNEVYANHGRYPHTNNYSLSFMYSKDNIDGYANIGLVRGAFVYTENGTNHVNMSLYMIQNGATLTYELAYYDTNNAKGIVSSGPLPFMLKDNTMYELILKSQDGYNVTKAYIKSNIDDNYTLGHFLGTVTLAPKKGFLTSNYNDMTPLVTGANYEECGFSIRTDNKSPFQIIDVCSYDVNSIKTKEPGFLSKYEIYQNISKSFLKKINSIVFGAYTNNPGADIRTFFSFNGGVTYKTYNLTTKVWNSTSSDIPSNGMEVKDVMNLSTYDFNKSGGLTNPVDNVVIKFVLFTDNTNSTLFLDKIDVSYNGPIIIDSWIETGTFYNGSQFYQSESGWSPYIEPDFNDASQNWVAIGNDKPSPIKLTATNGSKPSYADRKVFGGVRVLLNPKGKYYWRVASYNGI